MSSSRKTSRTFGPMRARHLFGGSYSAPLPRDGLHSAIAGVRSRSALSFNEKAFRYEGRDRLTIVNERWAMGNYNKKWFLAEPFFVVAGVGPVPNTGTRSCEPGGIARFELRLHSVPLKKTANRSGGSSTATRVSPPIFLSGGGPGQRFGPFFWLAGCPICLPFQ